MPKRIGYIYDCITSWSNLYLAYQKACKHKKSKAETTEWMYNCEKYLFELQAELQALGKSSGLGFPNPHSRGAEHSRGDCDYVIAHAPCAEVSTFANSRDANSRDDCSYKPQPYKYFVIREPKERIISVAAFRDRVVHHALVNVIEP